MTYVKIIIIAAIFLIGGISAWKIQGAKIDHLQGEKTILEDQLKDCQDANTENKNTISRLKTDVEKANSLCEARLKTKESLIGRLQEIDNIKPRVSKNETSGDPDDADPLLGELNGMFTGKADRKN